MLKNIAIPLMLASTEAEPILDAETIKDLMREDREAEVAGFVAKVSLACDPANQGSEGEGSIASLAQKASDAEGKLADACADVRWYGELYARKELDPCATLRAARIKSGAAKADDPVKTTELKTAWEGAEKDWREAVKGANAKENDPAILLDLGRLDEAIEAERAAAKDFVTKNQAYREAAQAAQDAKAADDAEVASVKAAEAQVDAVAAGKEPDGAGGWRETTPAVEFKAAVPAGAVLAAKDAAETAMSNAFNEHAEETLWRQELYCELGALAAGDAAVDLQIGKVDADNGDASLEVTKWWKMITDPKIVLLHPGDDKDAEPTSCTVPAIKDSDGETLRPKIKYLAAWTSDDDQVTTGLEEWTKATATALLNMKEKDAVKIGGEGGNTWVVDGQPSDGKQRDYNATGWKKHLTNMKRAADWQAKQLGAESEYYLALHGWLDPAATLAQKWAEDPTFDADKAYTAEGLADGEASALKAYLVAAAARGDSLGDNGATYNKDTNAFKADFERHEAGTDPKVMPLSSKLGTDEFALTTDPAAPVSYARTWASTDAEITAAVTAFKAGVNTGTNPVYKWWEKAAAMSEAVDAWHAHVTAKTLAKVSNDQSEDPVLTSGSAQTPCDTATSAADWAVEAGASDVAACKKACHDQNEAMLVDADEELDDFWGDAVETGYKTSWDYGGKSMAQYKTAITEWCTAYSHSAAECKLQKLSAATAPTKGGDSEVAGSACVHMVDAYATYSLAAATNDAWTPLVAGSSALHTAMVAATDGKAAEEKDWYAAWITLRYWVNMNDLLKDIPAGGKDLNTEAAKAKQGGYKQMANLDKLNDHDAPRVAVTLDSDKDIFTFGAPISAYAWRKWYLLGEFAGVKDLDDTDNQGYLEQAESNAAYLQGLIQTHDGEIGEWDAEIVLAEASVNVLTKRIIRAGREIDAQKELADMAANDETGTGPLNAAYAFALQRYNEVAGWTEKEAGEPDPANGNKKKDVVHKGSLKLAEEAKSAADGELGAATGPKETADEDWTKAKGATGLAQAALDKALDGADLAALRKAVTEADAAWDAENGKLDAFIQKVTEQNETLVKATAAAAAAVTGCKEKEYDAYRGTLEDGMKKRAEDLQKIQEALETAEKEKKAPGTEGARCEKALSNGTYRPSRGETTCGDAAVYCCGYARVWMSVGVGNSEEAAWRTIETCQKRTMEATGWTYTPARKPMATGAAEADLQKNVPFTCIEGAKKLAAVASAAAAAVYMLA